MPSITAWIDEVGEKSIKTFAVFH